MRSQHEIYRWIIKSLFVVMMGFSSFVHAGSLRLFNDSLFPLRAVIIGADGSNLGNVLIKPNQTGFWSSEEHSVKEGNQSIIENPSASQTPYTVHWYCPDGGDYGLCSGIATGALVNAKGCMGSRACKIIKKDKKQGESNEEDTDASQENLTDEGS